MDTMLQNLQGAVAGQPVLVYYRKVGAPSADGERYIEVDVKSLLKEYQWKRATIDNFVPSTSNNIHIIVAVSGSGAPSGGNRWAYVMAYDPSTGTITFVNGMSASVGHSFNVFIIYTPTPIKIPSSVVTYSINELESVRIASEISAEPGELAPAPCPVCGANELGSETGLMFVYRPYYDENNELCYGIKIRCKACGFEGPEVSGKDVTEEDALKAWNEAARDKS